jgi:hypothetical protein
MQLISRSPYAIASLPGSVHTWVNDRDRYQIDELLLDVANTTMQLNIAKESQHLDASLQRQFLVGI